MEQRIHEVVAATRERVQHLDECIDSLKLRLFGNYGDGGAIGDLRRDHRRLIWALVIVAFIMLSSGNGTISLQTLLSVLGKI